MNFGLKEEQIVGIQNILAGFPNVQKAIIFGSRAKGNYMPGSDIDLVLQGDYITQKDIFEITELLYELYLPNTIDLVVYHEIDNPELIAHIQRVGKIIHEKNLSKTA
jgi:predicted nucleotidyltransferase